MNNGYYQVAKNISSIINSIKLIYPIQPGYYVNWSQLRQLIISEIGVCFTEKGLMGIARAKQIEKFCSTLLFRHFASMLNKCHFTIILFIHSLLSETKNQTDKSNIFQLLFQSIAHNELQEVYSMNESLLNDKPEFLSLNSWINFNNFEDITVSYMF